MKHSIDFQKTLRDMATTMARLKRPERLPKMMTRFIDRQFGLAHTSFAFFEEKKNRFILSDSKGQRRFPLNLVSLDKDHLLVQAFQSRTPFFKQGHLHRSELAKQSFGGSSPILKAMDFFKAELIVPGYDKKNLLGLLILGKKKTGRLFTPEEISFFQIVAQHCSMAVKISKHRRKESNTYYEIMRSLTQQVHAKDPYTFGHINQVERLGMMTAKELKMNLAGKGKDVLSASLVLHDVGKIGIPDAILKKPARLNDEEWKIMRTHSEKGAKILQHLTDFKEVAEIVHCHHENFDGSGYPRGLKGERIPLESRIISVVDAFHAIVSTRCYSKGRPVETAFEELERCSGSQFDPDIVAAFTRALKREMKKRGVGFFLNETAFVAA